MNCRRVTTYFTRKYPRKNFCEKEQYRTFSLKIKIDRKNFCEKDHRLCDLTILFILYFVQKNYFYQIYIHSVSCKLYKFTDFITLKKECMRRKAMVNLVIYIVENSFYHPFVLIISFIIYIYNLNFAFLY